MMQYLTCDYYQLTTDDVNICESCLIAVLKCSVMCDGLHPGTW